MKKLIYANEHFIHDDDLFKRYARLRDSGLLITGAAPMSRVRPVNDYKIIHPVPKLAEDMTFAEATDLRANEIASLALESSLPIVVYWSGGIDSTVILTSILKNFPMPLLDRVVVKMSNASYVENPAFFNNVINKHVSYTKANFHDYNNSIILHGDPADALWLGGNILNFNVSYPNSHNLDLTKAKTILLEYLTNKTDKDYAEWLYNFLQEEAIEAGLELYTVADFFWWIIFNYNFSLMCLKHVGEVNNYPGSISYSNYNTNHIKWYASDAYQQWSINAQYAKTKFDGTTRNYKMEAKQYIYEYDKNPWYRDYKTKVYSRYRNDEEEARVLALYDDGEVVLNA